MNHSIPRHSSTVDQGASHFGAADAAGVKKSNAEPGAEAVLVIGHGTREPSGLEQFRSIVEQLGERQADWRVEGCFLELAEPTIDVAVDRLAAGGFRRIRAVPLILFAAGHAKRDIPDALARAGARNPGLEIILSPPLGCHRQIVELSSQRCYEALADLPPAAAEETLLILVGRGSSDPAAPAQLRRLAELRRWADDGHEQLRFARVDIAFAAAAVPALQTVLDDAAQSRFRRVIVQPHLLFAGNVLGEIERLVERRRADESPSRRRQWIVTAALGPDARVVTAAIDRVSHPPVSAGLLA